MQQQRQSLSLTHRLKLGRKQLFYWRNSAEQIKTLPRSSSDGDEVKLVSLIISTESTCVISLCSTAYFRPLPLGCREQRGVTENGENLDLKPQRHKHPTAWNRGESVSDAPDRPSDKHVVAAEFSPAGGLSLYLALHQGFIKRVPLPNWEAGSVCRNHTMLSVISCISCPLGLQPTFIFIVNVINESSHF